MLRPRTYSGTPQPTRIIALHYTPFPRRRSRGGERERKNGVKYDPPPPSLVKETSFFGQSNFVRLGGVGAWRGGGPNYRRFSLNLHFMHAGMGMAWTSPIIRKKRNSTHSLFGALNGYRRFFGYPPSIICRKENTKRRRYFAFFGYCITICKAG